MKTLFIEAKKKAFPAIPDFSNLPQKIGLLYSVQYEPLFEKIKQELENKGKSVFIGKSSLKKGQILGCNIESAASIKDRVDCFLLISSGKFHSISLMLNIDKPLYILKEGRLEKINENDIESLRKRRKAAISKFLLADTIGIIASTKQGQEKLSEALEIKNELKGKKVFIFVSETISSQELENFKIDFWINTACPGLIFDIPNMLNLNEYENIKKSIEKLK